jgi:hypothetical protein
MFVKLWCHGWMLEIFMWLFQRKLRILALPEHNLYIE